MANEVDVDADWMGRRAYQAVLICTVEDLSRLGVAATAVGDPVLADRARHRLDHLADAAVRIAIVGAGQSGKSTLLAALVRAASMPPDAPPARHGLHRLVRALRASHQAADAAPDGTASAEGDAAGEGAPPPPVPADGRAASSIGEGIDLVEIAELPEGADVAVGLALSRVDAALFVLAASIPLSRRDLAGLRGLLRYVDRSRIVVVLNQIDLVEPGERCRVIDAVAKHVGQTLGPQATIHAVSASQAATTPAAHDADDADAIAMRTLMRKLRGIALARRGVARLAAANRSLDGLVSDFASAMALRLARANQAVDAEAERAAALAANLDHVVDRIEAWFEEAAAQGVGFTAAIETRRKALEQGIRADVQILLRGVTFEQRDINDATYRDQRVRRAVNDALRTCCQQRADALKKFIGDYFLDLYRTIGDLERQWHDAAHRDLVAFGMDPPMPEAPYAYDMKRIADAMKPMFQPIDAAVDVFARHYGARCTVRSFTAAMNRFGRGIGFAAGDVTAKLRSQYDKRLKLIATRAVQAARFDHACDETAKAVFALLSVELELLAGLAAGDLPVLRWQLDRHHDERRRVREDDLERIEQAQGVVEDVRSHLTGRAAVLASFVGRPRKR